MRMVLMAVTILCLVGCDNLPVVHADCVKGCSPGTYVVACTRQHVQCAPVVGTPAASTR